MFPPANGAENFARDDALLEVARLTGQTVARVYAWDRPTISFGRNEQTSGWYTADSVSRAGLDPVRRRTGGRALVHHRELTYAIAGRAAVDDTLTATYTRLSEILVDALRALGVAASIAAEARASRDDGAPCFAAPSRGEIVVDGRKLVASAQWRNGDAYVQHGSILIDDDQSMLTLATANTQPLPPVARPATLNELTAKIPTLEELAEAFASALAERTGDTVERVAPESIVDAGFVRSRVSEYLDPAWTWRR